MLTYSEPEYPQVTKDNLLTVHLGATRGHLVAPFQKLKYAVANVFVDRSVSQQAGAVAEVGGPASQYLIETWPYILPWSHIADCE